MFQRLPRRSGNLFQRGFTLIELLIVTGIIAILLIILLSRISTFGGQINLDTSAQKIVSTLESARNQTLASEDESVYGVHFETNKYILFKGATYDPLDTNNKVFDLSNVEIYDTSVTGGSDVVFARVRGTTSNEGDIKVRLTADTSKTKTIVINPLGQSSLQESASAPTSRVTDTRHVHLDFGWSILPPVSTMTLIFSDPPGADVTQDIDIPTYTSGGTFEWEGTVDVNGSDQILRIHTHLMDASDTILSVHRDQRYNDKALEIRIDGTEIVTYTAAGVATKGSTISQMTQQ
jgi:prepilin-type N-terminal cleavage/methylation domain-containing protein